MTQNFKMTFPKRSTQTAMQGQGQTHSITNKQHATLRMRNVYAKHKPCGVCGGAK